MDKFADDEDEVGQLATLVHFHHRKWTSHYQIPIEHLDHSFLHTGDTSFLFLMEY